MSEHNQFSLLKSKRFLPLFITQFFGAFNDNVFKNALIIMLAFSASLLPSGVSEGLAVNISAGLFILPYFLFSSMAGQLADYQEKSFLIRTLKLLEIGLVLLCGFSIFIQNIYIMWVALFLMGTHSTFFGPLKYSILPQHLKENELVGGNSLIEMGTFVAILLGTIAGGILITMDYGPYYICGLLLVAAIIGFISATNIPEAPSVTTGKMSFNIFTQSWEIIKISREIKSVFLSILGISWFWFLGATFLAQFPILVKDVFGAHENVVTLLLMTFSIGIASGSLVCEKLSRGKIEPGLVPFGAIGMTFFGYFIYTSLNSFEKVGHILSVSEFLSMGQSYSILGSFFFFSVFGGFFTVPLYAMIQSRSKPENRSRTIASTNILNSVFMIASALFAITGFSLGLDVKDILFITIVFNALVSIYIFTIIPEFLMRFMVWIIMSIFYKVKIEGQDNIPEEGAAIVISNHVSFVDALLIFGAITRPVKFVMHYKIYNNILLKPLFKSVGAIPIASKQENEAVFNNAFLKISNYLKDGEIVMIFPEGKIAEEEIKGQINEFKPGLLKTLEQNPVPVIPSALSGVYGSMFSRKHKDITRYYPKSFFNRKVRYSIGKPITFENVTLRGLETEVIQLRDNT